MALFEVTQGICQIGDVAVDAEVRAQHGKDGVLTEHAVESGAPVTDHYRVAPTEVEIDGVVSDTPIGEFALPGVSTVSALVSALDGDGSPSDQARAALESYFDNAEVITIVTRRRTYENMVLVSFTTVDEASTANELRFTVRARQIRIADTATGVAIVRPKKATHQKKKSAGKATSADSADTKPRSILASALGIGS